MKPIAEFVVAPKIVITVPILVTPQLNPQHTATIITVHIKFYCLVNLVPLYITSSTESFIGRQQKGDAKATTIKIPNKQTYIATGVFPSGVAKGAFRMFYSSKIDSKVHGTGGSTLLFIG